MGSVGMRQLWACAVLAAASCLPLHAAPNGDYNGDGRVDVADVLLAIRAVIRIDQPTVEQAYRADMTQDGRLDITDVISALRVAVRLDPLPSADARVYGAVEGFVHLGPSGLLLSPRAALPDASPVSGATVTVEGSDGSATTDAQGYYQLSGLLSGPRRLRVAAPDGKSTDAALTLIGGATVSVGEPAFRRAQAVEAAKQAAAGLGDPSLTLILSPQQPLPPGVTVTSALGDDLGEGGAAEVRLVRPQWFFFVDPAAHLKYQHPVQYVFVDAETGGVSIREATSWPAINGLNYYDRPERNVLSPDLVQTPAPLPPSALSSQASSPVGGTVHQMDHVPGCSTATTYALIIQGSNEGPMRADNRRIRDLFGRGGIPPAFVSEYKAPTLDPLADIQAKFDAICAQATECDTIFLFITSHGTPGGSAKIDTTALNKDGTEVGFRQLNAGFFDFSKCKACHIIIIIDSCYSGRMLDAFRTRLQPLTGRKVIVMSSSDARHESTAYGWWDPRGSTGGAFTNSLVSAFEAAVGASGGGPVDLGSVFDRANISMAGTAFPASVRQQNPQFWQRMLQPGETCGTISPPPSVDVETEAAVLLNHDLILGGDSETAPFQVVYRKGTTIPLRRIEGGRVGQPDMCDSEHLHAGGAGIYIDNTGPYPDPDPPACGYGKIVQVPKL